jgi:hypothetical protein
MGKAATGIADAMPDLIPALSMQNPIYLILSPSKDARS